MKNQREVGFQLIRSTSDHRTLSVVMTKTRSMVAASTVRCWRNSAAASQSTSQAPRASRAAASAMPSSCSSKRPRPILNQTPSSTRVGARASPANIRLRPRGGRRVAAPCRRTTRARPPPVTISTRHPRTNAAMKA